MAKYYEVVIFTAAMQDVISFYTDIIFLVRRLDPEPHR